MISARPLSFLLLLSLLSFLPSSGLSSQTYTTLTSTSPYLSTQFSTVSIGETTFSALTTSTYSIATGTVPASYETDVGQQICYYLYYPFHVGDSAHKIVGSVSASTAVNFYLMSKAQYDEFTAENLPCGSSYHALVIDYLRSSFDINMPLDAGDYYILLENISKSTVNYTVQISAIENASNTIYSTEQIIQLYTSNIPIVSDIGANTVSTTTQSSPQPYWLPLAIIIALLLGLALFIHRRHQGRTAKEEGTRVY
jgi:hypothetical protein